MVEHTIRAFDTDLRQLAGKIAEMGRLDAEQISDATEALTKRDAALAKRIIAQDDRVDELQREIEEKAIATIARRQPMAVDLREIVGALRISNDLERVGDLAENIAKPPTTDAANQRFMLFRPWHLASRFSAAAEKSSRSTAA